LGVENCEIAIEAPVCTVCVLYGKKLTNAE
jgi:hypothetical protein